MYMWSLQFPFGVHAATCVRVGNALGAGDTARAIVTCKVVLVLAGVETTYINVIKLNYNVYY